MWKSAEQVFSWFATFIIIVNVSILCLFIDIFGLVFETYFVLDLEVFHDNL